MTTKELLCRIGLMPAVDWLRRSPEIVRWLHNGCRGHAPPPVKRMILKSYLKSNNLFHFIETGTHIGDTTAYIAHDKSIRVNSIELDEDLYHSAVWRFRHYANVVLTKGDSGEVLPKLVEQLTEPALFWLDGHYSGIGTGQGHYDTPISVELNAILSSPIKSHVILIDDIRLFNGENNYPHLDELLHDIRKHNYYKCEVSADIMRITPE